MNKSKDELKKQLFYLVVILIFVIIITILLNFNKNTDNLIYNNKTNINNANNIVIENDNDIMKENLKGLIEEQNNNIEIDYTNTNTTQLESGESIIIGNEIQDW